MVDVNYAEVNPQQVGAVILCRAGVEVFQEDGDSCEELQGLLHVIRSTHDECQ